MFAVRQKHKDDGNDLMQALVKFLKNVLYGIQIRKDNKRFKCKSKHWVKTQYDDNVLDYWKIPNGNCIVQMKKNDGLDGDNDIKTTLPSHLGAFFQ